MQESNTILVVIDPTKSKQHALEQASLIAQKFDKNLALFICTHDDSLKNYKNIMGEESFKVSKRLTLDKLSGILEEMAKPLRSKKVKVTCDVSWDWPLDEGIIRKALQIKPFLIVKDTHYHSKFARAIIKNTDWSLIKNCPFPILFDKRGGVANQPLIISSVNPINEHDGKLDEEILELGQLMAKNLNGHHKVFHSVKPLSAAFVGIGEGSYGDTLDEQNEKLLEMHQNRLDSLVQKYEINHEDVILEVGETKELLSNVVENLGADIVLMGSQTKVGLKKIFVGSTAEAVIDELDCNILVLKPKSFKTAVSEKAPPDYPAVVWPM